MLTVPPSAKQRVANMGDTPFANNEENAISKLLNSNVEMTEIEIQEVFTAALSNAINNKPFAAFEMYIKLADKGNIDALVCIRNLLLDRRGDLANDDFTFFRSVRNYCEKNDFNSDVPPASTYVRAILFQHGLYYEKDVGSAKQLYEKVVSFFPGIENYPELQV